MSKLDVFVKACPVLSGEVIIDHGDQITVHTPEFNHEKSIRIHKDIGQWKVELCHKRPGFGKPYLLNLTNTEKGDRIRISIVPQMDFLKTSLIDCTFKSLQQFTLTGPNITTNKSQIDRTTNGMKLGLVSYGTLRVSSRPLQIKNVSAKVIPNEGSTNITNIYVETGALLKCSSFETNFDNQGVVFINGTVTCGSLDEDKSLTIRISTGDLHVNVDGVLGNKFDATAAAIKNVNPTKRLNILIMNGNLTNFGTLYARDNLKLRTNNIMLCLDSKHDTAQRGFDSFISLQKDLGRLPDITGRPKRRSSFNDFRILSAVQRLDAVNCISILNEGIDPAVEFNGRSIQDELNGILVEGKEKAAYKDKDEKEIIRGGLATCKWRHGVIRSTSIECIVKQDIYDCSQLQANNLHFDVGGSVTIVKPWTWICGNVSGLVRGDFLFSDNAMLRRFNQCKVLRNVRIFKTSTVWVKEGGKLYIGETFENNNILASDESFVLDLGELKQDKEGIIINQADLLLAFSNEVKDSWFGNVDVGRHLFIQLERNVSCDAECFANECSIEFLGRNAQLVVNLKTFVEEGELNLKATDTSENPNFVLFGELHAKGINGLTANVCVMPGAIADLACSLKAGPERHTINVITRTLKISADSVMICNGLRDKDNKTMINDSTISTNIFSESVSVDGKLQAFGTNLNIQTKSLKNSGKLKLSPSIKNNNSTTSTSLCINCEESALNTGNIECVGDLIIRSEILFNEKGVIKSSPNMGIDVYSADETTLSGQIYVDEYFYINSQSQKKLSFSALGGKRELEIEKFVLPCKFEVHCEKGHLSIDSVIVNSDDNIKSECVFSQSKSLKLLKECHFGYVLVEFQGSEDKNNEETASKFKVEDSLETNHLILRSTPAGATTKERVIFEGLNNMTAIHVLQIDKSIGKVTFDTDNLVKCSDAFLECELVTIKSEIECVNVKANSVHVLGRMRCIQLEADDKPSTIKVEDTIKLSGSLECVGFVEVIVGNAFVQEKAKVGGIDFRQTLKIFTYENGLVSLAGSTKGKMDSSTSLEIEAKNINISGSITNVSDLKIIAEKDLYLTLESKIVSCESVEIKGEWITMAGSIEEFKNLHIEPWALLNSGKIDSVLESSSVSLSSDLALVNSGICKGQVTTLEAPFLLSLTGKEIDNVKDVTSCELVGRETIRLESITCFLGGSTLKSNKLIQNNAVLLFKFLASVTCTPDAKSLEAWSKAAEALKSIQSEYEANKENQFSEPLKSLKKDLPSAEIGLRIDKMYNMVNIYVGDLLKNGIESFDVSRLVVIITSESERYTKINLLKERLLAIPHKARKLRQWMKRKGIKELKSLKEKFGFFNSKTRSNQTEGILESGSICLSDGVTLTDSFYEAFFDEVFCDEGVLSACDVAVASREINMSKREKKAIAMVMYADELCRTGDVTSDSLRIKSQGNAKLVGKIKSDEAMIDARSGINLAYNDKSTGKKRADHQFKNLALKTNKISQVNNLLKGDGVYEDLNIADKLDLAVTDQDVVLSRCNIDHGYELKLQAKSVNIDNVGLRYEKGVSITSDQSLNVSYSSIASQKSAVLHSAQGNVSMDSSNLEAGNTTAVISSKGSISMSSGSISGDKGAILRAEKDVIIDPIERHHTSSSSKSGFFNSSKYSSSYSTVSKASISSSCGNVGIVSEKGKVGATATEISAAENISISAKEDVIIKDKVTIREEEHVKENWFRKKKTVRRKQQQHCSTLTAGGSLRVSSKDSNVSITGTDCLVNGDMMLHAYGTVLFKDRILSNSEKSDSSGFSVSLEKGFSYGQESKQSNQQRLAGRRVEVGGNLIVKAKNFDVKNAMAMDVGNMIIDAENVNFEGANLNNTCFKKEWSVGLGVVPSVEISAGKSSSKKKKIINQDITVRGRTHFTRAKTVNLTACNLDTGAISGNVENLNVISEQSEIEAFDSSASIGFAIRQGFPIPNKFGITKSSDIGKFVEKSSGIHCRGSINKKEFKATSLKLKGSSVTADGSIGNLAENIISEKVSSYRSQSQSGFSIGVDRTGFELGLSASEKSMYMEHEGTIASSSGIVSEDIKRSVNTDYSKHARITEQQSSASGFNLRVAKDGCSAGLQINNAVIGFCASKDKVGGQIQYGEKGISLSGGRSGVSASLQHGENSIDVGLSKNNLDMNVKTKETSFGTSLGNSGLSASVEHKNIAIAGSASKGYKSVRMKAGELETRLTKDKNQTTGEKSTSGSIKMSGVGVSGSISKSNKSIEFQAKDFKTGVTREKNSKTGKKITSANLKHGEHELSGTTSKDLKSLKMKVGGLESGVRQEKNTDTGKKTISADLKHGDNELSGTTSKDLKSLKVKVGGLESGVRQEKNTDTGKKTTSADLKHGDNELSGTTSKDLKSLKVKVGGLETTVRQEKNTDTGKKTTSADLKHGDNELSGTTSKDLKSLKVKVGGLETGVRQEKNTDTGKKTTSADLKHGDNELSGTTSKDLKSLKVKVGGLETTVRQEKNTDTGKKTTSADLKHGDNELSGTTSKDLKSLKMKVGGLETTVRQEKNTDTGKKTTSADLKHGDNELSGTTSKDLKSLKVKAGGLENGVTRDKKQ